MIEGTYNKIKTHLYLIFLSILFLFIFLPIYFIITNSHFTGTLVVFLSFLIFIQVLLWWSIYMVGRASIEKWAIRFDPEFLCINKSCGNFSFSMHEISEARLIRQGGMSQLGLKITDRKTWFKNLSPGKKLWVLANRLLTRHDIVIPLYMMNESPKGITESLQMFVYSDEE